MQIPDEIRKCVVFVCYKDSRNMILAGTAFLVGIPTEEAGLSMAYIITAKHVIENARNKSIDNKIYLRINQRNAGFQLVETPAEAWLFHPHDPSVDVAALNWLPPQEIFDFRVLPIDMAATPEIITRENIGPGDDVFLVGLFSSHYGSRRNTPIIRVGNIAAMPEEKVHTIFGNIDAYLVEARSIGGLSGSPVFAYTGSMRQRGNAVVSIGGGPVFYLLGLMHGHFTQSQLAMDDMKEDTLTNLPINMGIAIVVPVLKINEVLNQPTFVIFKEKMLQQRRARTTPSPDGVLDKKAT